MAWAWILRKGWSETVSDSHKYQTYSVHTVIHLINFNDKMKLQGNDTTEKIISHHKVVNILFKVSISRHLGVV